MFLVMLGMLSGVIPKLELNYKTSIRTIEISLIDLNFLSLVINSSQSEIIAVAICIASIPFKNLYFALN